MTAGPAPVYDRGIVPRPIASPAPPVGVVARGLPLALAACLLAVGSVVAQEGTAPPESVPRVLLPEDHEWTEIVPGIHFAAATGVWAEEAHGKFVRLEPGVATPLHTHTGAYHGVVVAGTVTNPFEGETNPPRMGPGSYWHVPGGAPHVTACVSEEPCLVYTHSDSAWDIAVVDPAEEEEE